MTVIPGASWRVSSRSEGASTCVEATTDGAVVAVQNSTARYPDGPMLVVAAHDWLAFLDEVAAGHLDRAALGSAPIAAGPFQVRRDGELIEMTRRDRPDEPVLRYTAAEWDVFVAGVTHDGEFTLEWLLSPPTPAR